MTTAVAANSLAASLEGVHLNGDEQTQTSEVANEYASSIRMGWTIGPTANHVSSSSFDPTREITFAHTSPKDVLIKGGSMFAVHLEDCSVKNVFFVKCKLESVRFENCIFDGVNWYGVVMKDMLFINCRFEGCLWQHVVKLAETKVGKDYIKDTRMIEDLPKDIADDGWIEEQSQVTVNELAEEEISDELIEEDRKAREQMLKPALPWKVKYGDISDPEDLPKKCLPGWNRERRILEWHSLDANADKEQANASVAGDRSMSVHDDDESPPATVNDENGGERTNGVDDKDSGIDGADNANPSDQLTAAVDEGEDLIDLRNGAGEADASTGRG